MISRDKVVPILKVVAKGAWDALPAILIAIPAFFIIVMMPFSYSITTGIQFGFILYLVVNLVNGKGKKVSPIIYIFTILFIIDFIYNYIS